MGATVPAVGATIAGKYLLEAMLGQGGMGAVYRARHLLTDRRVALKWMLPDQQAGDAGVQRFLREARAMGRIDHPSVVGVLDVGLEGDAAYLVMELLRGASLRDRITEAGMPHAEAIALLLPAMEGVAAAHAAGVVHRDLKPENLFVVVDHDGARVATKVLDFGVSKLRDDRAPAGSPGSGSITRTGSVVGTPAYMAPEQVRGARELDARTDVWALGAILYEMISGHLPFEHEAIGAVLVAIATEAPVRLEARRPDVPTALADVVHRALEKSPAARFASVEDLARALETFSPGTTFRTPRPSSIRPPSSEMAAVQPTAAKPRQADSQVATRGSIDVHVSVEAAPKPASRETPTPFVSSSSRLAAQDPPRRPIAGLVIGGSVVVLVAIAAFVAGRRGSDEGSSRPIAAAEVPAPIDAGARAEPDAGVTLAAEPPAMPEAAIVPEPEPVPEPVPEVRAARPRGPRRPPATAPTGPETPTAPAEPPGRTGALSREEF